MNSKNNLEWLEHVTPELLERLRYIALIESIGSSTRLAGSKMSDKEVEALLLRLKSDSLPKHDTKPIE